MRARVAHFQPRSVLVVIAVLVTACSLEPARGDARNIPVVLHIENGQHDAVVVSLLRAGVALRIGVVEGHTTRTFRVPEAYLGSSDELALRAESRSTNSPQSSPSFHVNGGENIRWILRGTMALSTFSVH